MIIYGHELQSDNMKSTFNDKNRKIYFINQKNNMYLEKYIYLPSHYQKHLR